ncbi:MAG: hypothetical protein CVV44_15035 [Spirochaetae bacterium HGW-Spirochaetae-1]|jgi:hypothetical protein|nr:MAG: hypothetical protein CVV44_15035 [Spirochaetae bacterium HGW-Spirochaetae-1]
MIPSISGATAKTAMNITDPEMNGTEYMTLDTIIGDSIDLDKAYNNKLYLSLVPENVLSQWSRVSDVANFIADFYNHDLPSPLAHNTISTVLNELIENAVKFAHDKSVPIDIYTFKNNNEFIFRVTNTVSEGAIDDFSRLCSTLFSQDLNRLYIQRIEDLFHNRAKTGIGLILLKKDYRMDINFGFSRMGGRLALTVTAKIKVE